MPTITVSSFKGGTAKTSTSLNLGAALAKFHKQKVLLIDFDAQAIIVLVRLPVQSEQTRSASLQKFGFAERHMIFAAIAGWTGDVAMRHQ